MSNGNYEEIHLFNKPGDQREPKGGWAPGRYINTCCMCEKSFQGDKRAVACAPCEYGDKNQPPPKPKKKPNKW